MVEKGYKASQVRCTVGVATAKIQNVAVPVVIRYQGPFKGMTLVLVGGGGGG